MAISRVALIYDDRIRPDTTGTYCKRALSCLTRTVHFRPNELDRIARADFDLFLNIDDGLRYRLPSDLRPCVWWAIDTHLDYEWDKIKAADFDFVFAAQRDGAAHLAADGIDTARWLPLACDPAFHRPHNVPKKWNIAFIGNMFPGPRSEHIELLRRQFTDVLVDKRFFDEMALCFSESRIVFNQSVRNDVNMRVFEAAATGSLLLTNDLSDNGLAELFDYGKHLEVFGSAEELIDKVAFYLSRDDARERTARAGRLHAYRRHTYRLRMQELLGVVAGRKAKKSVWLPGGQDSFRPNDQSLPLTSIVIPTFNQIAFTRQCLDSLRANTDEAYELIVVDNGSTDGTVEFLEDRPDIIAVCNRENRGFPAACNQGIRLARGQHIVLLNNDTIVPQGWLRRLKKPLEDSKIGLVGPCSNCVSGPQQIPADYTNVEELDQFVTDLADRNRGVVEDCDRLVGFCMLIDRSVVDQIGLLDERFGIGCFEDDDYTLRARLAGFRTVIARDAFVHHFGSQTFLHSEVSFEGLMDRNRAQFEAKWSTQNTDPKARRSNSSSEPIQCRRPRVLLLAHVGFLSDRLDRSQYVRYRALQKLGVVLFGPGIDGYRPGMSVREAIRIACNGERPDWIIHGLDPRASGAPIVEGLASCDIPTAYEFGDSWSLPDRQSHFINQQGFRLAFLLATRDLAYYRAACPNTEFVFLPNAVDTGLFRDYRESKQYDVLVYGAVNPDVYPLRARIDEALAAQQEFRVHKISHPDYYPTGGWDNPTVVAGEKLARMINRSWIAIATQSTFQVLLMKYLEIAACNTVVAGDMPMDGLPFFGQNYVDLSQCHNREAIVDVLGCALADKCRLQLMASHMSGVVTEELSAAEYANRVVRILSEFSDVCAPGTQVDQSDRLEPGVLRLWHQSGWPECRPDFPSEGVVEGWMADGAQQALRESLNGETKLVVELGSWLGLSTRFIADCAPRACVIAIDHFRGSSEHQSDPKVSHLLPHLRDGFLSRCWDYRTRIVPLAESTTDGLQKVSDSGLRPDAIYVDASHDYESVKTDLLAAWSLFPKSILIGDDFLAETVQRAVGEFAHIHHAKVEVFGRDWPAWRLTPPRDQSAGFREPDQQEIRRPGSVSLCMIVRNNESTITECLESIKPWVDEMIVVDTGSQDSTPAIAKKMGAKVFHFPWPDSFAIARNESLRHAAGEWVFWMDSDDTITAENGEKLRELVARSHPANVLGFIMQVHCPNDVDQPQHDVTVVDHVKLFRNRPNLRFEGRVHEQIMPAIRRAAGEVVWTDIFVNHSGSDQSYDGRRRKQQRDMRLLQLEERESPDSSFVHFNIGMTLADVGDHVNAVNSLKRSLAVSQPGESHIRKIYALLIASLCQLGQFAEAGRVCRQGLSQFPRDTELLFREGFIAHQLGELDRAVKGYRAALDGDGERHFSSIDRGLRGYKTRHNLATVYEDTGQLSLAEEQWRLVIKELPTYRAGWIGLVNNQIMQGQFERAAAEIETMCEHHQCFADTHYLRAQLFRAQGSLTEARQLLEAGLAREPANADLLEALCRLLFETASPEEAEPRLRELVGVAPDQAAAWHNLGSTYLRLRQHSAAKEAFRVAIQRRPDAAASHLYLGYSLETLGDIAGACQAWEEAHRIDPHGSTGQTARECLDQVGTQRRLDAATRSR